MEHIYRTPKEYTVLSFMFISLGYTTFLLKILYVPPELEHNSSPSKNSCNIILPHKSADRFDSLSLRESQALIVHFHGNNLSSLKPSEDTDILDPVNLVWVESITAPFLSLDLGFNVYSFKTLWQKVHIMSLMVEFESPKCSQNISYSCVTASLAEAFLTNVTQLKGALCYVIKYTTSGIAKYKCCHKRDFHMQIKCNISASESSEMFGIFLAIVILGTIFLLCFPVIFTGFPDEVDSSQTISANAQARNPLYRFANLAVQRMRYHNKIKRLVIGFSLPIFFYIDCVLICYTAKYDIPKMFNDAVSNDWKKEKLGLGAFEILTAVFYILAVLSISFSEQTETLDFSQAPRKLQRQVQRQISLITQLTESKVDWMVPYSIGKQHLWYLTFSSETSLCLKFLLRFLVFPVYVIFVYIWYGIYISPVIQKGTIFFVHAFIHLLWWTQPRVFNEEEDEEEDEEEVEEDPSFSVSLGIVFHVLMVSFSLAAWFLPFILSHSLLLVSRFITYLIMGIVASKDDFLPLIALFTLFVFYIWNCFSFVGNTYKGLLEQTYSKCEEYQEKQERKVIKIDEKEIPRIKRLSDLFQNVVDEILPFSKAYTVMFLKIVVIGSFLVLIYCAILVYGETSLKNDLTKTMVIFLTGLIPKLVEIFRGGKPKEFVDKENACKIKKIVEAFFEVKEVGIQTADINPQDDDLEQHDPNPGETSNRPTAPRNHSRYAFSEDLIHGEDTCKDVFAGRDVAIQTEMDPSEYHVMQEGDPEETPEDSTRNPSDGDTNSQRTSQGSQGLHQLVHADVNPRLSRSNSDPGTNMPLALLEKLQTDEQGKSRKYGTSEC